MDKIIEFAKKYALWIVLGLIVIYVIYTKNQLKKAELRASAAFEKLNGMVAKSKQGAELAAEKASLLKLVDNASVKEREILIDLLNGSIIAFEAAEKATDKAKAKQEFGGAISKVQADLIAKHGQDNITTFKAKMDKYGFDI